MDYEKQHLRDWLIEHKLLNILALEKEAELPKDTVTHFINERRGFPEKHYSNLVSVLFKYGYQELNAE